MFGRVLSLLLLILIALPPSPAHSQAGGAEQLDWGADPISCYRQVHQLGPFYGGHLNAECFTVPAISCIGQEDPAQCLRFAITQVSHFLQRADAQLPQSLPLTGIWPGHYARARADLTLRTANNSSCRDHPQAAEEVCAFLDLLHPTMQAFNLADLAGFRDGFSPVLKLTLRPGDTPAERNPLNCFAAIAALNDLYRWTIGPKCAGLGTRACQTDGSIDACLEVYIATMRPFVRMARDELPSPEDRAVPEKAAYVQELSELDKSIADVAACDEAGEDILCKYIGLSFAAKRIFEIAHVIEPQLVNTLLQL